MKQFTDQESKEILHSAISMTWLRPESGLALASFAIHGKSLNSFVGKNSLDMACGCTKTIWRNDFRTFNN